MDVFFCGRVKGTQFNLIPDRDLENFDASVTSDLSFSLDAGVITTTSINRRTRNELL